MVSLQVDYRCICVYLYMTDFWHILYTNKLTESKIHCINNLIGKDTIRADEWNHKIVYSKFHSPYRRVFPYE